MGDERDCVPASEDVRRAALERMSRQIYKTHWTVAREAIFFAELAETANVTHSARQAGMTDRAAHQRRRRKPDFAAKWVKALEEGYARLEMMMLEQAMNGAERVETVMGPDGDVRQVKTVRSFPHSLAMTLMKSHRATAENYRMMETMRDGRDEAMTATIRAELDRVRARLAPSEAEGGADAGGEHG